MKGILVFAGGWFCLFAACPSFGHDPKITLTTVEFQADELHLHMEIPWSLNRAVMADFPMAENIDDQDIYKEFIRDYILGNVELFDSDLKLLPCDIKLGDGKHMHSLQVDIKYTLSKPADLKLRNTLLFNLYSDQQNFHQFSFLNGNKRLFITDRQEPQISLILEETRESNLTGPPIPKWPMTGILFFMTAYAYNVIRRAGFI